MSDLQLVLTICGFTIAILGAFVALVCAYAKISQDYEDINDIDYREHAEPVARCGDCDGRSYVFPDGCCSCRDDHVANGHHEPGDPPRR